MYRLTPLIALVILLVVYFYYPSNLMTVGVLLAVWYWYSNMRGGSSGVESFKKDPKQRKERTREMRR